MSRIIEHCGPYEEPERFAIIELAAPDGGGEDDNGQLYFGDYDIRVDCTGDGVGDVITDCGLGSELRRTLTPAGAYRWGTNLIAAALAADPTIGRPEEATAIRALIEAHSHEYDALLVELSGISKPWR